ncbi:hypothetical protein V1524DRAFT_405834 [Lipomyces starkeyi]
MEVDTSGNEVTPLLDLENAQSPETVGNALPGGVSSASQVIGGKTGKLDRAEAARARIARLKKLSDLFFIVGLVLALTLIIPYVLGQW